MSSLSLPSGTMLGHYRIVSPLGAGGMGTVYLAEDTQLRRQVAIKILRPDAGASDQSLRRVLREARAAAKLDHPNICTVYEVSEAAGHTFIVMQHVEGETLDDIIRRRPLGLTETIKMAAQVADAIAEAHDRGVIHRDLKPSNVMVTSRGQFKVMDFGLAQIIETPDALAESETRTMTGLVNVAEGTLPYMSPEQLRGDRTDARSDVFSFGVLLYEALSGRRPFDGSGAIATVSAILTSDAIPLGERVPDVPPEFARIVHKAIDKDPARRYQSARDLAVDLHRLEQPSASGAAIAPVSPARGRWSRGAIAAGALVLVAAAALGGYAWFKARAAIGSIAVIPIVNAAGAEADYLSDGMTNDLIQRLSEIPSLKVMSQNAVFHYKGGETDAKKIGRELGIEAVLFGRMTKRGDMLDFQLELVSAADASFIWGQQYERSVADLVSLQREIPLDISTKLRQRLGADSRARLTKAPTESGEAYELYLKGRYAWEKWTTDGAQQASGFYNRAITIDPSYARAYAGLADAYMIGGSTSVMTPQEMHRRSREMANKALSLDPGLAEPHSALATVLLYADWDLAGAEREYRRALELNPNCAECHHLYSHLLLWLGRYDESLTECRRLLELDPVSETPVGHLANHYLYSRQYPAALKQYEEDRRRFPDASRGEELGEAYYFNGRMAEAFQEYIRDIRFLGGTDDVVAALRDAYARGGIKGFFRKRIDQLQTGPQSQYTRIKIAVYYTRVDENELALKTLEAALAAHDDGLVGLKVDPGFDRFKNNPRFQEILRRVGLPQ